METEAVAVETVGMMAAEEAVYGCVVRGCVVRGCAVRGCLGVRAVRMVRMVRMVRVVGVAAGVLRRSLRCRWRMPWQCEPLLRKTLTTAF